VTQLSEILVLYACQIREDPVNLALILDPNLPYLGAFLANGFGQELWDMGHA